MAALARVLIRVFFRRVEVDGAERLPPAGPVLLVANHTNGLVDGLLLIAMLRRYPRFLGKSTLFRILPLKPFLSLAGVVPVYRASDEGGTAGNDTTFRRCRELLVQGVMVAIFPEGISHDEASLQPLRTGAARIALGAAFDGDAPDLVVVPVGLSYDAKARFRSRALVTIGAAAPIARWADRYRDDPQAAVRDCTDEIGAIMRAVGPDYATVEQADVYSRIADVAALDAGAALPVAADLADRELIARSLARIEATGDRPDVLAELRTAHATYERDLALLGVPDRDVAAAVTESRYRSSLSWSVVKAVLTAPVALLGALIHAVPYQVMKRLALLPKNEGIKSTVKLLGCFALFTIEWLVLATLTLLHLGAVAALIVLVGCPAAGYVTVRFAERVHDAGGLVRSYRTLRSRQASLASVRANRDRVVHLARALVAG